jgi:hypothetical protein
MSVVEGSLSLVTFSINVGISEVEIIIAGSQDRSGMKSFQPEMTGNDRPNQSKIKRVVSTSATCALIQFYSVESV